MNLYKYIGLAVIYCSFISSADAVPASQIAPAIAGPLVTVAQGGCNANTYVGCQTNIGLSPGTGLFSDSQYISAPFLQETITTGKTLSATTDLSLHIDAAMTSASQVLTLPAVTTKNWGYGAGGVVNNNGLNTFTLVATSPNTIGNISSLTFPPTYHCAFGSTGYNFTVEACPAIIANAGLWVSIANSGTNNPALTGCTGSLTADSTNQRGHITLTGASTTCTLTFNTNDPWPYSPSPYFSASFAFSPVVTVNSATVLTFTFSSASSGTINYGML